MSPCCADTGNHVIWRLSVDTGAMTLYAGTSGSPGLVNSANRTAAKFNSPHGLAFDLTGSLYVADNVSIIGTSVFVH